MSSGCLDEAGQSIPEKRSGFNPGDKGSRVKVGPSLRPRPHGSQRLPVDIRPERTVGGRTVSAGVAAASVPPLLAVGPGEAERTEAAVAAGGVLQAGSSVEARPVCTGHGADLTVLPVEALRTGAGVVVDLVLEGGREGVS